jgi:pimeloyl-ACP methyl ester carboxylesterase
MVIQEIERIKVPTLLLIGMKGTTAIGKDRAPPEVAKTLGNYAALAPAVTARIKGASLVTFDELGRAPQVEDRDRCNAALLKALDVLLPPQKQ